MRTELIIVESEADHRDARALIDALMPSEAPADVARLRAQALLVADWEAKQHPPLPADPIEAIKFRIEQLELSPREVKAIFGASSRVSEVLSGKRGLSLAMIRRAHRDLDIPLEILVPALDDEPEPSSEQSMAPAVPIKRSVTPDYIICLEDGKKFKALKRHLRTQYGMTPEQYREKWGLPPDYPMVAPNYARARSELAQQIGLGRPRTAPPSRKRA